MFQPSPRGWGEPGAEWQALTEEQPQESKSQLVFQKTLASPLPLWGWWDTTPSLCVVQEPPGRQSLKQQRGYCDAPISLLDSRTGSPGAPGRALAAAGPLDQRYGMFLGQSAPNDWSKREQKGLASLPRSGTTVKNCPSFCMPRPCGRLRSLLRLITFSLHPTCFLPFLPLPSVIPRNSHPTPNLWPRCVESARSSLILPAAAVGEPRPESKAQSRRQADAPERREEDGPTEPWPRGGRSLNPPWGCGCPWSRDPKVAPGPPWEDKELGGSPWEGKQSPSQVA